LRCCRGNNVTSEPPFVSGCVVSVVTSAVAAGPGLTNRTNSFQPPPPSTRRYVRARADFDRRSSSAHVESVLLAIGLRRRPLVVLRLHAAVRIRRQRRRASSAVAVTDQLCRKSASSTTSVSRVHLEAVFFRLTVTCSWQRCARLVRTGRQRSFSGC